ncbi:MAG: M20/M25/M40 family metallo-hydrolase [Saprospiraceae bacterium]|nr:M20/M25/M40 family metallo-hydrolase [Saprospiraceae bacterium]
MKKYSTKLIVLSFLFIIQASNSSAQPVISSANLKKHVTFLASDKLEGRGTGSVGEQKAAKYIAKQFKKIGLKPGGTEGSFFHMFSFKKLSNPHATEDSNTPDIKSQNIVGFLDNNANVTIIVGAHYDHLGLGHDKNSLDANPDGKIHNGADDNASGTSGVIELARYFAKNGKKEPFNFLFVCFSGEELGLIGSKKFAETPSVSPDKINFMVNMDMIGRYRTDKGLIVHGYGTSPMWGKMLSVIQTDIKIIPDSSGVGPSDFTSFYLKKIPVLGFFTGQHSDYHKPTDDSELINYEGEKHVLEYIARIIEGTCTFPKLEFSETKQPQNQARSFKVTMGVMPDYAFDKKGMRIDGVTEGKPAAKAGLKAGDIILKIGDLDIKDVYAYMDALSKFKKGETTKVVIQRGSENLTLDITF